MSHDYKDETIPDAVWWYSDWAESEDFNGIGTRRVTKLVKTLRTNGESRFIINRLLHDNNLKHGSRNTMEKSCGIHHPKAELSPRRRGRDGMKSALLLAKWVHPPYVEKWLRRSVIGSSLNVCCGQSLVGDVRVDLSPDSSRTEEGDLFNLRFEPQSFDTVICDPPFSYYVTGENRFRWLQDLGRIARKRVIVSVKGNSIYIGRRNWKRELYYIEDNRFFLRLFWVFDRLNGRLESEKTETTATGSEKA